jgi:hypothetical protein
MIYLLAASILSALLVIHDKPIKTEARKINVRHTNTSIEMKAKFHQALLMSKLKK